jgi:hypothetical protein
MTLEPINQLALEIQQYKGMFALLLGSGVSRSAGIPTGWEIVVNLINRLAAAAGVDIPSDPAAWYAEAFGEEPDYSKIIMRVARTREQRAQVLRQFFEPSPEEHEDGLKQPTAAHHAIAKLVARGYVRVIVTTNFDRLIERALELAGVAPAIITSSDQVRSMIPLQHSAPVVFKIHGDYFDTRIRNVTDELAKYDRDTTRLIDRIVAEYGLIACGWSGEWDTALRSAILGNTHQRLNTFWLARRRPAGIAGSLLAHTHAIFVPIESADSVWPDIQSRVESIDASASRHPSSPEISLALCKRFLAKALPRIELHDLFIKELATVRDRLSPADFSTHAPFTPQTFREREARYAESMKSLTSISVAIVKWGNASDRMLVIRAIKQLCNRTIEQHNGKGNWIGFQLYPASLLFYAVGLTALASEEYGFIKQLFEVSVEDPFIHTSIADLLCSASVVSGRDGEPLLNHDSSKSRLRTSGSDWYAITIPLSLKNVLGSDIDFEDLLDRFDILIALSERLRGAPTPHARFMYRRERGDRSAFSKFFAEIKSAKADHPLVHCGLVPKDEAKLDAIIREIVEARSSFKTLRDS